jgi:hypothetical protein
VSGARHGDPGVARRLPSRPLARQVRPEGNGRLGVERNVELAQSPVALEVPVGGLHRHRLFRIRELQPDELFRTLQRVLARPGPGVLLCRDRGAPALRHTHGSDGYRGRDSLHETPAANVLHDSSDC